MAPLALAFEYFVKKVSSRAQNFSYTDISREEWTAWCERTDPMLT